MLVVLERC